HLCHAAKLLAPDLFLVGELCQPIMPHRREANPFHRTLPYSKGVLAFFTFAGTVASMGENQLIVDGLPLGLSGLSQMYKSVVCLCPLDMPNHLSLMRQYLVPDMPRSGQEQPTIFMEKKRHHPLPVPVRGREHDAP